MIIEEAIDGLVSGANVALPMDPRYWDADQIANFAEFGTPNITYKELDNDQRNRRFAELRSWMDQISGKRLNAVYLDTTTLHTARTLVLGGEDADVFVVPPTLLDLSNFVNSVLLFDHIFYLENGAIDPFELNEALGGEPVIVALPVESFGFGQDDDPLNSIGGLLRSLWYQTESYIIDLQRAKRGEVLWEDAEAIKRAWRSIFDFVEDEELWFDPLSETKSESYHSDGPKLLEDLTRIYNQSFDEAVHLRLRNTPKQHSELVHRTIDECNYRSMFNMMVSNSLQLYYMPNSFRLPFRNFFHEKATIIQRRLPTIWTIEEEYHDLAAAYSTSDQDEIRLPFFLAAVLNKISTLDEFFDVLADFRRQATVFRAHRAELDEVLQRRSIKEIKRLRAALQNDGDDLRMKFPLAPIAGGIAAVLAALTSGLTPTVLTTIGALTLGSQLSPHFEKLKQRALQPQYRFLTNMKDVADGLTLSYPVISRLWGLDRFPSDLFQELFAKRFANLKALSN